MWTRAQLKEKAKFALKQNYWKIILVCTMLILLGTSGEPNFEFIVENETTQVNTYDLGIDSTFNHKLPGLAYLLPMSFAFGVIGLMVLALLITIPLVLAFAAFIGNPLDLGARKFLLKTLNEKAEVKEVAYAFDSNYKNIVKILFFRDLYIILWSLLFIIPGIVKSYEYFMIPYLLIENPNLTQEEAFQISKQMMMGQKWNTFVLQLSFFGWDVLAALTLGILNIFYVAPYRNLSFAALFEELNAAHGYPARHVQRNYEQEYQQVPPHNTTDEI